MESVPTSRRLSGAVEDAEPRSAVERVLASLALRPLTATVQLPSLAEYERCRTAVSEDEVALAAWRLAEETRCVLSFERSFMRPVFE